MEFKSVDKGWCYARFHLNKGGTLNNLLRKKCTNFSTSSNRCQPPDLCPVTEYRPTTLLKIRIWLSMRWHYLISVKTKQHLTSFRLVFFKSMDKIEINVIHKYLYLFTPSSIYFFFKFFAGLSPLRKTITFDFFKFPQMQYRSQLL